VRYETLRALNKGSASNADLADKALRTLLHVRTPLDALIPSLLGAGRDVVLTGNPGDGKSHLARHLDDQGQLRGAHFEPDLSASALEDVIEAWSAAAAAGRPALICANEGPLLDALPALEAHPTLGPRAAELRAQLGRLVANRPEELAPEPQLAALVDLADRHLGDPATVERLLETVATDDFLPIDDADRESSPSRNIELLFDAEPRARLAGYFAVAARACGEHVTFRQLWGAVSEAVCGGLSSTQRAQDVRRRRSGAAVWRTPLALLLDAKDPGPISRGLVSGGDPLRVEDLELDERLWRTGGRGVGEWLVDLDSDSLPLPAERWAAGDATGALQDFRDLKLLAAIAHRDGERLLQRLSPAPGAGRAADAELRGELLTGLRRLFIQPSDEGAAPPWLLAGAPLWVSLSYERPAGRGRWERPFVAAAAVAEDDIELLRPVRAPWLRDALGPIPDVCWLRHRPSGVTLRVDAPLRAALRRAATLDGPMVPPDVVVRFLARLSGWEEARWAGAGGACATLASPRGQLYTFDVRPTGTGWAYGVTDVGT
jgi:hypothetical protein